MAAGTCCKLSERQNPKSDELQLKKEAQVTVVKETNITAVYGKEFIRVFMVRKDSWVTAFPFA